MDRAGPSFCKSYDNQLKFVSDKDVYYLIEGDLKEMEFGSEFQAFTLLVKFILYTLLRNLSSLADTYTTSGLYILLRYSVTPIYS